MKLLQRLRGRFAALGAGRRDVAVGPGEGPFACPCCASSTLPARGEYELCPVCFWEDDGQDDHDADVVRRGPNGLLSLTRARANYAALGACDPQFVDKVRSPTADERAAG